MGKLAKLMGMSVHVKLTHKMIKIAYIHENWTPWKLPTYHTVHVYTPACCSLLSIHVQLDNGIAHDTMHALRMDHCVWYDVHTHCICVALMKPGLFEVDTINYMHCIKINSHVLSLLYPACSCKGYYCNTVHVHVSDMSVYLPSSIVIIVVIVCTYM